MYSFPLFGSKIIYIMEAFIIEEKVLQAEHMQRSSKYSKLKFIKKYDIPIQQTSPRPKTHQSLRVSSFTNIHSDHRPTTTLHKTRHLLSNIQNDIQHSNTNTYNLSNSAFTRTTNQVTNCRQNQQIRNNCRQNQQIRTKNADQKKKKKNVLLLTKKYEPNFHQYDSNLSLISQRSPGWCFSSEKVKFHHATDKENISHSLMTAHDRIEEEWKQKQLKRTIHSNQIRKCAKANKMQIMKSLQNNENQNKMLLLSEMQHQYPEEKLSSLNKNTNYFSKQDVKLYYSNSQLLDTTNQILKKYHFQNNSYFRKLFFQPL